MTVIRKLLQRLDELGEQDPPPIPGHEPEPGLDQQNTKEGYRLVCGHDIVWFICIDDAKQRYHNSMLKTDNGVVRVLSVQPVDDSSHNCHFCGAQLEPPGAGQTQDQTNASNLQALGMNDLPGNPMIPGGNPPAEGGVW